MVIMNRIVEYNHLYRLYDFTEFKNELLNLFQKIKQINFKISIKHFNYLYENFKINYIIKKNLLL